MLLHNINKNWIVRNLGATLATISMLFPVFAPAIVAGAPPTWWTERNVLDPTATENNLGPANLGQAKWMAEQAKAELAAVAPDLANQIDLSLISPPKPATPDATWFENQKKALNIGQLKAISKQFYDFLPPSWLSAQASQNGLNEWIAPYPWKANTPIEENMNIATIGQLKLVFSLRFNQNEDGDSTLDFDEHRYFETANLDVNLDAQQWAAVLAEPDPAIRDLDGDSLTDAEEIERGLDPFTFQHVWTPIPWDNLTVRLDARNLDSSAPFSQWNDSSSEAGELQTENHAKPANANTLPSIIGDAFQPNVHGLRIQNKTQSVRLDHADNRIFSANDPAKIGFTIIGHYRPESIPSSAPNDNNTVFQWFNPSTAGVNLGIRKDGKLQLKQYGTNNALRLTLTSQNTWAAGSSKIISMTFHGQGNGFSIAIDGQTEASGNSTTQQFQSWLNDPQILSENFYLGKSTADQTPDGIYGTTLVFNQALSPNVLKSISDYIRAKDLNVGDLAEDTDGDGLLGWEELEIGTDPTNADSDDDGLSDGDEVNNNTDPNNSDSDGDGITDGSEVDQETDPNDPNDTPNAEWIILTGDLEEDKAKKKAVTITIPAGETRLVVVYTSSEEYPDWTGPQSEFNDLLSWQIRPDTGQAISGNIDVNARHGDWEKAEAEGLSVKGFSPAHIEIAKSIQAPANQAMKVKIKLHATNIGDGILPSTALVALLPVELAVTKEGEAIAPEDGLVVKKSDTVRYRLLKGVPDNPVLLEDKIQWHWRILKWDGTYEAWKPFQDGKGHTFAVSPKDSGIYEIKATLDGQDFFFKRKKDDPHSAKKKDENDCFGVVDEQWQIDVRHEAKRNLGSKAYAQGVRNSNVPAGPPGGYKCNLFVGHKASDGGATVPKINGRNPFSKYFPTANQWAGTEVKNIPNWTLLGVQTYPQPGFVVARGRPGGIGHTGIVGYDGAWISAGTTEVNRKADVRTYKPSRFSKYTP